MTTLTESPTNRQKVAQLETALADLLREALTKGFHGAAGVEVSVQDGTIQHIRRRIERLEK